ncbi:MAG TPA: NADP oxidoreductase, partial [Gaiellaceae bacterium]|nr:NADP oxidoreductase [Gaiellaceae bacterium]
LRFLLSPVELEGEERVEAVELVHNRLEPDGRGGLRAVPTEERETVPAGIVFRSVGYRGVELPGVPFDEERGVIRNVGGRVVDESGAPVAGVYAAGWIKRGPSGVIGTNKKDATETVELLLEDDREGRLPRKGASAEDAERFMAAQVARLVMYDHWTTIDDLERAAGEKLGRPRVKLVTWDELLSAAENLAAESA